MKIAQCTYNQAGINVSIGIGFDTKAFEFIYPALNKEEEDDFIRQICDSIAAITPKESSEKNFFIKRVLRIGTHITLFCTDGLLIDTGFTLPITQQAFAKERIKITDPEQPPAKFRLSSDMQKAIIERYPGFEEYARKHMPQERITAAKETQKQDTTSISERKFASDKATEVLAEIGNVKKEIKELAVTSAKNLSQLLEQIDSTHKRVFEDVMRETQSTLQYEDNKKRLDDFAKNMISQFGGGGVEKSKALLSSKIAEITPIPEKFEAEIDGITKRIVKQTTTLSLFKTHLITALYDAAKEYSIKFFKEIQAAPQHAKKTMLAEFNKKFAHIATLSDTGNLTSLEQAQATLGHLTFENLEEIISSEHKESPGLLQKCNTSWTEESQELQIVIKHLTQVNTALSGLFKDDPQFSSYADKNMVEIIRIPFPRSFQFKFSASAMNYKKSVDEFCKTQKDRIINMSKTYKKTIQIDDARYKAKRAITEIQKQTEIMKKPVAKLRDFLKRKEISGDIIAAANKEHELILQLLNSTKQIQQTINTKIDPNLKMLKQKIISLADDIQDKGNEIEQIFQNMRESKSQIDLAVSHSEKNTAELSLSDLDEMIKNLDNSRKMLSEQYKFVRELNKKLSIYQPAFTVGERVAMAIAQSNMRKQQNEAKNLLLQLIKNQSRDVASTDPLKKHMVEIYTLVDNNVANIDKIINELANTKKDFFNNLNSKAETPADIMQAKLQKINDKLQELENTKTTINDNISKLRKISLESASKG